MIARPLAVLSLLLVLVTGCDKPTIPDTSINTGGNNSGPVVAPAAGGPGAKAPAGAVSSTNRKLVPDPK